MDRHVDKVSMHRPRGFTLIELMVVVAIIGVLAAIAIPGFLRFQCRAKQSEAKTSLRAIRTVELVYFGEFGVFIGMIDLKTVGGMDPRMDPGKYYNYSITSVTATNFIAHATNAAPLPAVSSSTSTVDTWMVSYVTPEPAISAGNNACL